MIATGRPDIRAAASPALLQRGCVNVIGLDALRATAGTRWPRIRDWVHARLEAILRQSLGPADFFVPLDDVAYLVTMPASDPDDAKVACLRVAFELYSEYLGKSDFGSISIYRAVMGEGDSIVLERIPTEELKRISERAEAAESNQEKQNQAESTRVRSQQERQLLAFEMHYLPVWDAKNEAITLYTCLPQRLAFQHAPSIPVTLQDLTRKERTNVEVACVQRGAEVLARSIERGERFLMAFRVSFETLSAHNSRVAFISACRELPSDFRQYLVLIHSDVPAGVPHSRLSELIMALKPYSRAVMSEVPFFFRDYVNYQGIGLQAIGFNFERQRISRKEIDDDVQRLAVASKRLSVSTFLSGVADQATLKSARQSGVNYMTGHAIAPFLPEPGPMKRLHWDEVVKAAPA
ncbi:MAG TPA: hypothetical protein VHT51_17890 [Micropepsaceae bacterium]|nr:hypothetical protein [Micropepsaceae bacterium]